MQCFLLIGKTNLDKVLASEVAYGRFGLKLPSRKCKRGGGLSDTKIDQPYVLSSNERRLADERSKMIIMTRKDLREIIQCGYAPHFQLWAGSMNK